MSISNSPEIQKKQIRELIRSKRKALSFNDRESAAQAIAQQLVNLPLYQKANKIAVYSAMPEEISLAPFIEQARQDGKLLYLPIIAKDNAIKTMHFEHWANDSSMSFNQHGISQPKPSKTLPQEVNFDLILVPLVAFNYQGQRLGMGGGYYDRFFAAQNSREEKEIKNRQQQKNYRIGIAHSQQFYENIPHEKWDINLDAMVTEKKLFFTRIIE